MVVPSWTEIVKKMTRTVGEEVPNRIITCSNCRHGMGVPNGIRYGDVIGVQSLEQEGRTDIVSERIIDQSQHR